MKDKNNLNRKNKLTKEVSNAPVLLAPNGKPSNLNPEQYKLVRSNFFKLFFGDWEKLALAKINDSGIDDVSLKRLEDGVSKIVDSNGEPLVCYHGTNSIFTIFDKEFQNTKTGFGDFGAGFYFTSSFGTAKYYTLKSEDNRIVMSVFLKIMNPFIIELNWEKLSEQSIINYKELEGLSDLDKDFLNNTFKDDYRPSKAITKYFSDYGFQELLKRNNFDGVFANRINIYENPDVNHINQIQYFNEIVCFEPNQIKLADGMNTTFDPNNPDIRFEGGGGVKATTERFRPTETVNFNPPLIGTNGNKLVSYTWKYDYVVDVKEGEDISKRVSDWTQAETNAETGRDIVHVFDILDTNGKLSSVSSESVPVALGFITKDQKKSFINLATSAKTLAKQQLQLSILKAKNEEIKKARQEIIDAGYPEITYPESSWNNIDEDNLYMKMGDGSVVGYKSKPNDPERLGALKFSYINSEMKKRGLRTSTHDTYDLEQRIKRQEQKVQRLAGFKSELFNGGGDVKEVLLAPNGKPSNLTSEQYKLVREPFFLAWFGNWMDDPQNSSKAVDENGEPRVCYHASPSLFYEFNPDLSGWNTWHKRTRRGSYFSSSKSVSETFVRSKDINFYEVFLNLKNPTVIDGNGKNIMWFDEELRSIEWQEIKENNYKEGKEKGFIILNTIDTMNDLVEFSDIYIVYNPADIKLADGTNKTFNPNNPDIRYAGGGFVSFKHKYNKKFGYPKYKSHDLKQISKDTRVSLKGLQQIYNKGIGAFKTNPSSVRPTVKSKEQWAMARVYSAVMGGKAAKIDSNELKMKTGGEVPDNYIYVVNNFGSGEVLNKVFNEWKNIQSEKDQSDWGMRTKLLRFGTYGQFDLFYVMEKFDFDKSDKINGILKRDFKEEVQNAYENKIKFDGGGDVEASDWDNLEERGAAEVTIKLNEFLKANGLNTKVNLSNTSFGRSQYIYATDLTNEFPDESNAVKIRISDHSVSNFDRMFNEIHLDLNDTEYDEALGQYILAKVRFKIGRLRKEYFTHEIVTLPETKRLDTTNLTDKDVIISESLTKKGKPLYKVERTNYKRFNQYTYIPTGKIFETIPVDEIEEKRKKERAELAELKERMDNDIEVNDFLRQKYEEGKVVRTLERTYDNLETFKRKHPDYEFIEQRDLGGGAYKYFFMREKDGYNQHTQYDPNYQLWLKENIINKNNEMEKENKTFGGGGGVNTPKNDPNDIYIKAVEYITGQGIETDSLRIEGNNVYFKYKNKTYELSLNKKQVDDTISVKRKFLDMRQRYAGGGGVAAKSSHTLNSSKGKIAINLDKKWSDIEILLVPISFLAKCSEFNRRNNPKYSLEDSAKNIENIKKSFVKNGIIEPLILSYIKNESKLLLLEGNHRLNALIELEVPYYPVCVTIIDSWAKGKGKGVKTKIKPYFVTEIGRARYTSVDNFEGVPFVNMENNHVDVNETDTLTINVPLLIRLFEYIREDVDNDAQIHFLTENLLKLKNKPELSMIDYDSIIDGVKPKKTAEKILALGGLAEGPPHSKGGIPLVVKSTGQNIEIEGGELVVNKFSSSETEKFEFEGKDLTPCEIVSELNSMDNNGVEIDCNKIVGRFKK